MIEALRDLMRRLSLSARSVGPPRRVSASPRRRLDLRMEPDCIYAIGDVHGCLDKLRGLEEAIIDDARSVEGEKLIVCLGDYIDRGPSSAAVIDHLLAPTPAGFYRLCLAGNHEEVLTGVLSGSFDLEGWLGIGGDATLRSYSIDVPAARRSARSRQGLGTALADLIPPAHVRFLQRCPVAFSTPSFLFVHAGVRPGIDLLEQDEHDLLWIRDAFLQAMRPYADRTVVHGHTPSHDPILRSGRVGIDTGAYMGGPLTAVRLLAGRISFIQYGGEPIIKRKVRP